MTSDQMPDRIPLCVMHNGGHTQFWNNFLNIMYAECAHVWGSVRPDDCETLFERHLNEVLAAHGATTDWSSDADPVWFSSQEQLTAFVLTYS
jgi:hypothetical protein